MCVKFWLLYVWVPTKINILQIWDLGRFSSIQELQLQLMKASIYEYYYCNIVIIQYTK